MNQDMEMFSFHNRLESFAQWPHVDCNCTPEKVITYFIQRSRLGNYATMFLSNTIYFDDDYCSIFSSLTLVGL